MSVSLNQAQVDRLLVRRLMVQRYLSGLIGQVRLITEPLDQALIRSINDFVNDGTESDFQAFAHYRRGNGKAATLRRQIQGIVAEQRASVTALLLPQMSQFIEREVAYTARVLNDAAEPALSDPVPSVYGVATQAVDGVTAETLIGASFGAFAARVLSELARAARHSPTSMARVVRGSADQDRRDGVMRWRDEQQLRPRLDTLVNGTAANAAIHTYRHFQIEQVTWLATLDFRTCPSCYTAEVGSPYKIGRAPRNPMHPNCRCMLIPSDPGVSTERPFVRDTRPVRQIPRAERPGRIGTTMDTIEQFFARMSNAQREEYMGKTRARAWADGTITDIRQLVDESSLEPLTLAELPV